MYEYRTQYDASHRIQLLCREIHYGDDKTIPCTGPDDVYSFCTEILQMERMPQEEVVCICLDNANMITGYFIASIGTANKSLVSPRDIFIRALLTDAVSIILAHNHPSRGKVVSPSSYDSDVTQRMAYCADMLGIGLLDHIIIGCDGYYSYYMQGNDYLLKKIES